MAGTQIASAQYVLTFNNVDGTMGAPCGTVATPAACGDNGTFRSDYGSVSGVVTDTHGEYSTGFGSTTASGGTIKYRSANTDGFTSQQFAEGQTNSSSDVAFWVLTPDASTPQITINSLQIGQSGNTGATYDVEIYDAVSNTLLYNSGAVAITQGTNVTVSPDLTYTGALRIEWGGNKSLDQYGIDNLTFEVGLAPEPSTMLMFSTGLIALAGVARRKRKTPKPGRA